MLSAALVLFSSVFAGEGNSTNPRYDKILHEVAKVLTQAHFSPQSLNDQFSAKVFADYLDRLDPEKNIFLKEDIEYLKKFEDKIDDELRGKPVGFFYEVNDLYKKRLKEVNAVALDALAKPYNFTIEDSIVANNPEWPASVADQKKNWYKKLKYMSLERYADLLDDKKLGTDETMAKKTDADLEVESRRLTSNVVKKYFDRQIGRTTDDDRFSLFINAITNMMDPHTDFFMPVEKRSWDEDLSGKFYGIGATITEENGYPKIFSVTAGGPAWRTGEVNDGDLITKIAQGNSEPVDVAGYDVPDAIKLIRGAKGSVVKLTLKKADGTSKTVAIEREEMKLDEVFAKSTVINDDGHKTGYIYLPKFYTSLGEESGRNCSEDIARELIKLKKENVESVIIDIRDNGGGSLYEVIRMVGLFIPKGPVVQVKSGDGRFSTHGDNDGRVLYDGPLVVMVNEFSASASEIFAAAIQDYHRGVVIGSSSTYGKGTVQRPIPLSDHPDTEDLGTIHLTIQKYYRINGSSTQLKGVEPDIVLPGYYEYFKMKEKDNPSALAWDELKKLNYSTWDQQPSMDSLTNGVNRRHSLNLNKIKNNVAWLASQSKGTRYLSLNAYEKKEQEIRQKVEETRKLMQLSDSLDIKPVDTNLADGRTAERNDRWLKSLKKDAYLAEAVHISGDLIRNHNSSIVKR